MKKYGLTNVWKIYGRDGHRQAQSFGESTSFIVPGRALVEIIREDLTGTNEYCIIRITSKSLEDNQNELEAQLDDGIFENSRVGKIIRIF